MDKNMNTNKVAVARYVAKLAWTFVKGNGMKLDKAMHVAWLNARFTARLAKGQVKIAYVKADGTIREALCLAAKVGEDLVKGTGFGQPAKNQLYWDLEANDFRCFCKARLVEVI